MRHPKGLIPIVLVVLITIIAATFVGGYWWYQKKSGELNQARQDEVSNIILQSCKKYYDGCNTCNLTDDNTYLCTNRICKRHEEPKCLDNENTTSDTNAGGDTNTNTRVETNANTSTNEDVFYANWEQYTVNTRDNRFYRTVNGAEEDIPLTISLEAYNARTTPFGILFWKKGETGSVPIPNFGGSGVNEEFEYEQGTQPDFHFYSFFDGSLTKLPEQTFTVEQQMFERVFGIEFSGTERLLAVEVGRYDTKSDEFVPGLIESQPVSTRGIVYDIDAGQWLDQDPISTFTSALDLKTTQWRSLYWDSKNHVIVGTPGGEGCGAYSTLEFVDTKTGALTKVGGEGSFTFRNDDEIFCNPRNAGHHDGPWLALSGINIDGTVDVYLFTATSHNPVKSVIGLPATQTNQAPYINYDSWDTSNAWPIVELSDGQVVDFNL